MTKKKSNYPIPIREWSEDRRRQEGNETKGVVYNALKREEGDGDEVYNAQGVKKSP